jgi:hypothetical protein
MPRLDPEAEARQLIDRQLEQCGWAVQDRREMNISAALGVAIREFSLTTGEADYMLYADGRAIGVVEAKPVGHTFTGVETQSGKYLDGLPAGLRNYRLPLPFAYESTGEVTQFTNALEPNARSRDVFTFHRPEEVDATPDWRQTIPTGHFASSGFGPASISSSEHRRARLSRGSERSAETRSRRWIFAERRSKLGVLAAREKAPETQSNATLETDSGGQSRYRLGQGI